MPTPLRKSLKIHHVSSIKNASFDPDSVTPHSTGQSHLRPVCRWLTYSSSYNSDTSEEEAPTASRATLDAQIHLEEDEEENFQTVPLDDEHWTTEEVPDRTLCIHDTCLTAWTMPISMPIYKTTYFLPMPTPWI